MDKFGKYIGYVEMGVNPDSEAFCEGVSEVWDSEAGAPAARLLVKAARDLMIATGRGGSAPAYHLHFISKSADWNLHCREVANHVASILKVMEDGVKEGSTIRNLIGGGTVLGRGALYGALGLGGGLGALYWLLSRHANQDSADMEAMNHQIKYYNQLSHELEDSMRRKYRYDRGSQTQPDEPVPV